MSRYVTLATVVAAIGCFVGADAAAAIGFAFLAIEDFTA